MLSVCEQRLSDKLKYFTNYTIVHFGNYLSVCCDILKGRKENFGSNQLLWQDGHQIGKESLSFLGEAISGPLKAFVQAVGQRMITYFEKRKNKKKASELAKLAYAYQKDDERAAIVTVWVEACRNIYYCFEPQFESATVVNGGEIRALQKLGENVADRVIDYYLKLELDETITASLIIKAVLSASLKTPGREIRINLGRSKLDETEINTSNLFTKVGIIVEDGRSRTYYSTPLSTTKTFGYRRLYISESRPSKLHEESNRCNSYSYILTKDNLQQFHTTVLQYVNEKDPKLKDQRLKQAGLENTKAILQAIQSVAVPESLKENVQKTVEILTDIKQQQDKSLAARDDSVWFQMRSLTKSFKGRKEELKKIDIKLNAEKELVLHGMGGAGKSDTVRFYAFNNRDKFVCVIWIDSETETDQKRSFRLLATRLGIPIQRSGSELGFSCVVTEVYKALQNRKSLIIFDNAKNFQSIKHIWPPQEMNKMYKLVTSRKKDWETINRMKLDVLNRDDACELMKTCLGKNDSGMDTEDEILRLVDSVQYLPLALQQAAACIVNIRKRRKDFTITNYLEKIEEYNLLDLRYPQHSDNPFPGFSDNIYTQTVFRTMCITLDVIKTEDEGLIAQEILDILAYMPADCNYTCFLFDALKVEKSRVEDALCLISEHSLAEVSDNYIHIHRLVQMVLRILHKSDDSKIMRVMDITYRGLYFGSILKYAEKMENVIVNFYAKCENTKSFFYTLIDNNCVRALSDILNNTDAAKFLECRYEEGGLTPLHKACERGYEAMVELFLSKGAKIDATNYYSHFAVHIAVKFGQLKIVELLASKKDQYNCNFGIDNQALLDAISGHFVESTELAEILLKNNVETTKHDINGNTALHLAVDAGKIKIVKLLIQHGADIHAKNNRGRTPLFTACERGYIHILKLLIENHADINEAANDGDAPLHNAVYYNSISCVSFLIQCHVDINAQNNVGETPAYIAAYRGRVDILKLLLKKNKNAAYIKTYKGNTLMHAAAECKEPEMMQTLLSLKSENATNTNNEIDAFSVNCRNHNGETPLHRAASFDNNKVINLLISNDADITAISSTGSTALHVLLSKQCRSQFYAYSNQRFLTACELIKNGLSVNVKDRNGGTALLNIIYNKEIAEYEEECVGLKICTTPQDRPKKEHLHKCNHFSFINLLLVNGADINEQDNEGNTVLHKAAALLYVNIMEYLLKHGANINARNKIGETPFQVFLKFCNPLCYVSECRTANNFIYKSKEYKVLSDRYKLNEEPILKLLIDYEADLHIETKNGLSLLFVAAQRGKLKMLELLKSKTPNWRKITNTNDNFSLLHMAYMSGDLQVIDACTSDGTDFNCKTRTGVTPLHEAAKNYNVEAVKLLISKGARIDERTVDDATPLHWAVCAHKKAILCTESQSSDAKQKHATVAELLHHGADINAKDTAGRSVLFCAIRNHANYNEEEDRLDKRQRLLNFSVIKLLIEHKANINVPDNLGYTPLHIAVAFGFINIAKLLIQNGADCNTVSTNDITPLFIAASLYKEEIELTFKDKSDLFFEDKICYSWPIFCSYDKCVSLLDITINCEANTFQIKDKTDTKYLNLIHLKPSATLEDTTRNFVEIKDRRYNSNMVTELFENRSKNEFFNTNIKSWITAYNPNNDYNYAKNAGETPFFKLKKTEHQYVPTILIFNFAKGKNEVSVDLCAVHTSTLKMCELLLENGAQLQKDHFHLVLQQIHWLESRNLDYFIPEYINIVKFFIENFKNSDIEWSSVLHAAVIAGDLELTEIAIKNGAETMTIQKNYASYLELSITKSYSLISEKKNVLFENYVSIIKLFIDQEVSNDICWSHLLQIAIISEEIDLITFAINKGANPNEVSIHGEKILHYVVDKWLANKSNDVFRKYSDIINVLIKSNVDINAKNSRNINVLHKVICSGKTEILEFVIKCGIDVTELTDNSISPVLLAVKIDHSYKNVDILLNKNKNIGEDELSALLHAAIHVGNVEATKIFLRRGARVDDRATNGVSSLHLAIDRVHSCEPYLRYFLHPKYISIIKVLIKKREYAKLSSNDWLLVLHSAIIAQDLELCEIATKKGANVNDPLKPEESFLQFAINSQCDISIIKHLLKCEADINFKNSNGFTALHTAIAMGKLEITKLLLLNGAEVGEKSNAGISPFRLAVQKPSYHTEDILKVLIYHGADINEKNQEGFTILHTTVLVGNLKFTKFLIANGVKTNVYTKEHESPLQLVTKLADTWKPITLGDVFFKYISIIKLLIEHSTDENDEYEDWPSVLRLALFAGDVDLMKIAVDKGACLDELTKDGVHPLMLIINYNEKYMRDSSFTYYGRPRYASVVKYLVENDADVHMKDENGCSLLYLAISSRRSKELVEALIAAGVDVNERSPAGVSPLELANEQNYKELAELLKQHEAIE